MNTLAIKPWSSELQAAAEWAKRPVPGAPAGMLVHFPDFLIHRLARHGIGRVEAQFPEHGETVCWQYVSRATGERHELARIDVQRFRPTLARFAAFARLDNVYFGHTLFAVEAAEGWPVAATHQFSLFLCNEPTMGIWLRLYLYGIDGVWPMKAGQPR